MKVWFERIAIIEGVSYLILLGIAMPLKHLLGIKQAVTYVGWGHGILFILYIVLLSALFISRQFNLKTSLKAALLGFIPFGWRWL